MVDSGKQEFLASPGDYCFCARRPDPGPFYTPRFESISTGGNIFLTSSRKAAGVLSRNFPSRARAGAIEHSFNIDPEKC
jgi:hypothetical protein